MDSSASFYKQYPIGGQAGVVLRPWQFVVDFVEYVELSTLDGRISLIRV